jgi:uncharacterized protein
VKKGWCPNKMRVLYVIFGTLFLGIGVLGAILPVLPTTPFLLLTTYFYAKGSKKFHQWFISTKLYKKHLESFVRDKSMTRKQKWTLMIITDMMLIISYVLVSIFAVKIFIILLIFLKHLYFHTQVKII